MNPINTCLTRSATGALPALLRFALPTPSAPLLVAGGASFPAHPALVTRHAARRPTAFVGRLARFFVLSLLLGALATSSDAVTCEKNVPPSNPDSYYTVDAANGVVSDSRTGLMWKRVAEPSSMTWEAALSYAEAHSFAGYSDWRLPNIKELQSLVEECWANPAINDTVFPGTSGSVVWSGSPHAYDSSYAWYVSFNPGDAGYTLRRYTVSFRLVRGGQSFGNLLPPTLSNVSVTTTTLTATSNVAAAGYWIAVARGATAPTAAQVKARVTYAGVTIAASGSGAMGANSASSFPVAGLSASTPYDFYLVAEDAAGNVSLVAKAQNSGVPTIAIALSTDPTATSSVAHGDGHLGGRMDSNVVASQKLFLKCTGAVSCPWTASKDAAWLTISANAGTSTGIFGTSPGDFISFTVDPWESTTASRTGTITITINDGTGASKAWAVTQSPLTDSDGDGIPDEWEFRGIPDTDGSRELLPEAQVGRKDLWIWIDEADSHPESYRLQAGTLNAVVAAFGRNGIFVHSYLAAENGYSRIPALLTQLDVSRSADIDLAKSFSFFRRAPGAPTISRVRDKAWRYVLWGTYFREGNVIDQSGGVTPGFGYDGLVYIAPYGGQQDGITKDRPLLTKSLGWQATTLLHELGHMLGLAHGGPISLDGITLVDPKGPDYRPDHNYKPNHVSVMNYAYGREGLLTNRGDAFRYDFEAFQRPSVNENALASFWERPVQFLDGTHDSRYGISYACKSSSFNTDYQANNTAGNEYETSAVTIASGNKADCGKALYIPVRPPQADLTLSGTLTNVAVKSEWDKLIFNAPKSFWRSANFAFLSSANAASLAQQYGGAGQGENGSVLKRVASEFQFDLNALPDTEVLALPGQMVTTYVAVDNVGFASDRYRVAIVGSNGVTATLINGGLTPLVLPGNRIIVPIAISVSAGAVSGATSRVAVTFASDSSSMPPSDETSFRLRVVTNPGEVTPAAQLPIESRAPNAFVFSAVTNAPPATFIESDIVSLTGFNVPIPIQVRGGEMSINGDVWTHYSSSVHPGNTLRLRATSSQFGGEKKTVELAVGGLVRTFDVTTKLTCNLDINGDSTVTATNDAVLIERYLMGFRGDALTAGLSLAGLRSTSDLIATFLGTGATLEVFGRTPPVATLDGLVLVRLMQGVGDDALLNGVAIPPNAQFTNARAIRAYVNSKCGTSYASP